MAELSLRLGSEDKGRTLNHCSSLSARYIETPVMVCVKNKNTYSNIFSSNAEGLGLFCYAHVKTQREILPFFFLKKMQHKGQCDKNTATLAATKARQDKF